MASAKITKFLTGDLTNGIYDEFRALTDYIHSVIRIERSVRVNEKGGIYQLSINFNVLKRSFPTFVRYYGSDCNKIISNRTLVAIFGETIMTGNLTVREATNRVMSNISLINKMLNFYSISIVYSQIAEALVSNVNMQVIDYLLNQPLFADVKEAVEGERALIEAENIKVPDRKIPLPPKNVNKRLFKLPDEIDIIKAKVKVSLFEDNYLRIVYTFERVPTQLRIKANVKIFHIPNVLNSIINVGTVTRETLEAFETMLVFYAHGHATLDDNMVLVRKSLNTPVSNSPDFSYTADYFQLCKKDKGGNLWRFYTDLINCFNMTEFTARAAFEMNVVDVLIKLGMLNCIQGNVTGNICFYPIAHDVGELVILEATTRAEMKILWSAPSEQKMDVLRNVVSSLMIRVANNRKVSKNKGVIYTLFPVSSYGPTNVMHLDLRFANFILKAILLSLS